ATRSHAMLNTARDLLVLFVAIAGALTVSLLFYNRQAAESANAPEASENSAELLETLDPGPEPTEDAIALANHPVFKGQITPQQAEKLIQAALQLTQFEPWDRHPYPKNCLPYYIGMYFNDLGAFYLYPASMAIHIPSKLQPGQRLTKEQ